MRHVGQVDGEQPEFWMMDQHEEENQADEGTDEQEESEEQTLAGTHTVNSSVTCFVFKYDLL